GRAPTDPPVGGKTTHGGTHGGPTGASGMADPGTGAGQRLDVVAEPPRAGSVPPPTVGAVPQTMSQETSGAATLAPRPLPRADPPPRIVPPFGMPSGLGLGPSGPMPSVLAPGDAAQAMAHAIVTRATGALSVESQDGVRRAVLREGDLVTAASGVDSE